MDFNEVVKGRRSIRKFKGEPIPNSYLEELMEAARLAPSGLNLQPWRYVIVKDKLVKEKLANATPSSFISEASVIIICCADNNVFASVGERVKELHQVGAFSETAFKRYAPEDFLTGKTADEFWIRANIVMNTAISIEHIALKAVDLGLGSCWIGSFDGEKVRAHAGIEDRYSIVALMAIGYPEQEVRQRPRLSTEQIVLKEI